jgi:hypothetical protein
MPIHLRNLRNWESWHYLNLDHNCKSSFCKNFRGRNVSSLICAIELWVSSIVVIFVLIKWTNELHLENSKILSLHKPITCLDNLENLNLAGLSLRLLYANTFAQLKKLRLKWRVFFSVKWYPTATENARSSKDELLKAVLFIINSCDPSLDNVNFLNFLSCANVLAYNSLSEENVSATWQIKNAHSPWYAYASHSW